MKPKFGHSTTLWRVFVSKPLEFFLSATSIDGETGHWRRIMPRPPRCRCIVGIECGKRCWRVRNLKETSLWDNEMMQANILHGSIATFSKVQGVYTSLRFRHPFGTGAALTYFERNWRSIAPFVPSLGAPPRHQWHAAAWSNNDAEDIILASQILGLKLNEQINPRANTGDLEDWWILYILYIVDTIITI